MAFLTAFPARFSCSFPCRLLSHNSVALPLPFLSTRQPSGGPPMKMLGSERGVVEEWLSEFKVSAFVVPLSFHMALARCPSGGRLLFLETRTVGVAVVTKECACASLILGM